MGLEALHTAFRQSKNGAKVGCRGVKWTVDQDARFVLSPSLSRQQIASNPTGAKPKNLVS
jgi:hypothetical protein